MALWQTWRAFIVIGALSARHGLFTHFEVHVTWLVISIASFMAVHELEGITCFYMNIMNSYGHFSYLPLEPL